ncbi:hypothetical protein BH10ACI3_BH10ACI3_20380 [soil metagenome]
MISLVAALQGSRRRSDMPARSQIRWSLLIRSAILTLGIIFCLLPQTAEAQEWRNCRIQNYLGRFDPRLTVPQPCDVIATAEIRWGSSKLAILRAIRLRSTPITDTSAFVRDMNEAAAGIGRELDRMGGDLNLEDITILFTNFVSPAELGPHGGFQKGAFIAEAHELVLHQCPVAYYKQIEPEPVVFFIAHEVFHCVQYSTFPSLLTQNWLIEGSADYFGFLVKPTFIPRFIPDFDHDIPTVPLGRMDYAAVPFYLWQGNAFGPQRVKEFLDSARTIESSIPPDMLGEFAKAYFGPTIRMPDGRAMPSHPAAPATRSVSGSTRIASPVVTPYTLKSELITFERGKVYDLSVSTAPADARTAWRTEPGGAFGEMPTSVSTCDGEKQFLVVRTTTTSRRAGDITVTAQPATSNPCACPAGTWQETAASAKRYFEQKGLGIYSGDESTKYISGGRTLTLNPDHTGSLTYVNVQTVTTGSGDLTLHQTKTGGSHFTWKVVNGKLLTVLTGTNNFITLDNQLTTSNGTTYETRHAAGQSIGHAFTCDDTGLHLRQVGVAHSYMPGIVSTFNTDMDFVRVGSTP